MPRNPILLDRNRAGLLVIDIQKKILAVMAEPEKVVENAVRLIKGFKILKCPIFITEQYPEGIGKTVTQIKRALGSVEIPEKLTFSCCGIEGLTRSIRKQKIDQFDGFQVSVVRDALSSRNNEDYEAALNRMVVHDIEVSTTEMVLFELLKEAGTADFKKMAKLIK